MCVPGAERAELEVVRVGCNLGVWASRRSELGGGEGPGDVDVGEGERGLGEGEGGVG